MLNVLGFIVAHPLCANRRLAAITRFAKWQLRSRVNRADAVYQWFPRVRFNVRRGETGLTGNIYTGLHEFEDMGFLLHCLRASDTFVDVGANSGSYTLLASGVVGAHTVAFEPLPETYARLVANVRLNQAQALVRCVNAAVGDAPGSLKFTTAQDTVNHVVAGGESDVGAIQVPVHTLDEQLASEPVTLMKIDVEGFETKVIEGAAQVLASPTLQAVIMELNGSGSRYGFDEAALLKRMLDLGFSTFTYDPFARALLPLYGGKSERGNTLFLKQPEWASTRVREAPGVTIHGRTF